MSILRFFKFNKQVMSENPQSFYDLSTKTIDGEEYPLTGLKGKKVVSPLPTPSL